MDVIDSVDKIKRSKIWQWLGLIIFLIALLLMVLVVPWQNTWQVLTHAKPSDIAIAFVLALPAQFLNAMIYRLLAKKQGMPITVWQIWRINLVVSFYEIMLPSTLVGSSIRWYRYSQRSKKPAEAFTALTYFKVFNIFLVLLLSLGFVIFSEVGDLALNLWQLFFLFSLVTGTLLLMPLAAQGLSKVIPLPKSATADWVTWLLKGMHKILFAFSQFRQFKVKDQLVLILCGVAAQVPQFIAYLYFARAVGIELSFTQLGTMRFLLLLAMNLPLNFSPGIGLREVSIVVLLTMMGFPLAYATAMSALLFTRTLFYGLIGGLLEVAALVTARRQEKSDGSTIVIDDSKSPEHCVNKD